MESAGYPAVRIPRLCILCDVRVVSSDVLILSDGEADVLLGATSATDSTAKITCENKLNSSQRLITNSLMPISSYTLSGTVKNYCYF